LITIKRYQASFVIQNYKKGNKPNSGVFLMFLVGDLDVISVFKMLGMQMGSAQNTQDVK